MSSNKITQDRYEMIYIKQNNVVIVHREPYTVSILTKEQAEDFGYNISKMKEYESISINGIPEGGYELVENCEEEDVNWLTPEWEAELNLFNKNL
ncbi:hypothetical protein [Dryocola clanedunensis]|uniref:hypothetical protein n=1 Tax=Cedecea sulfonylureivorans TaxID=3051154 RepID=UPI001928E496|nr:hypothetical protein [Cedecea sulfonylureivorans]ELY3760583.1 hypothetical protein [Cronobacter universalis]